MITQVVEAGRALVIAINKWDTLDEDRHYQLEKEIERELARVKWATRVNISAATGRGVNKLADHLRAALASWESRVPTAELNTFVRALVQETPPPARGGRAPKIKYVTQADVRPPRFVVFSTGLPGGRLPAVPGAQAARAVGLRGHADRGLGQGPRGPGERQAPGLTAVQEPVLGSGTRSIRSTVSIHAARTAAGWDPQEVASTVAPARW